MSIFFFQAEDGIRDHCVTGVQTCALPISTGYAMEDQAALVASALNKMGLQDALVVGHSMGFDVATALASQSDGVTRSLTGLKGQRLVDRVVDIDEGPDSSYGADFPFLGKLGYVPVLGQGIYRITPDFAVEDSY